MAPVEALHLRKKRHGHHKLEAFASIRQCKSLQFLPPEGECVVTCAVYPPILGYILQIFPAPGEMTWGATKNHKQCIFRIGKLWINRFPLY